MKRKQFVAVLLTAVLLSGCTTVQTISKLDTGAERLTLVCVVEHKAVREEVLEVVKEGLKNHGVSYRVIAGNYQLKEKVWLPTFESGDANGCDAMLFYVANWNWDIAWYMRFANIWMTTPDLQRRLGSATYDARASLNKFINAREKLLELLNGLFVEYKLAELQLKST